MKSFHIITFGCQMNEHDSERMTGMLEAQGCASTNDAMTADMIILNTCSIREKAEQKFFSELGRLKKLKDDHPGLMIAVAGCIAQQEGPKILSRAPYVDMIFGPSDIARLPDMVRRKRSSATPVIDTSGDAEYHRKNMPATRVDKLKAWVSIMYGCDNFCTYCVVPYLRGRERSRTPEDIINEIGGLARQGYKEVTLLGQNVNSYGKGLKCGANFPALLHRINDGTDIMRIRFVTSHPRDLSGGLIAAIRDLPKVCESIHLPVQSGSDNILTSMNRKYTRGGYLDNINKLRQAVPKIALTSDIIVGFPGETEQDFQMTMKLLEEAEFDSLFAFKYSKRPGTAALKLSDHLPEQVKEDRLARVLELQKTLSSRKNRNHIGTIQEILVDGCSKKGGMLSGRTRGNKTVNVEAPVARIGSFMHVRITSVGESSLSGQVCE